mmetsp:Transcript_12978/g.33369  ORF Transcript_12978/g.33369 Transcript_12978/m.33369 type:complete len:278 (+) Transcript_12978:1511-2344(+)
MFDQSFMSPWAGAGASGKPVYGLSHDISLSVRYLGRGVPSAAADAPEERGLATSPAYARRKAASKADLVVDEASFQLISTICPSPPAEQPVALSSSSLHVPPTGVAVSTLSPTPPPTTWSSSMQASRSQRLWKRYVVSGSSAKHTSTVLPSSVGSMLATRTECTGSARTLRRPPRGEDPARNRTAERLRTSRAPRGRPMPAPLGGGGGRGARNAPQGVRGGGCRCRKGEPRLSSPTTRLRQGTSRGRSRQRGNTRENGGKSLGHYHGGVAPFGFKGR